MKIGDRVRVQHGRGTIVGKDLPDCECWRWIVRVDDPLPECAVIVEGFKGRELCYFSHEMEDA